MKSFEIEKKRVELIERIVKLYPTHPNKAIAKYTGADEKYIQYVALKNKLKKIGHYWTEDEDSFLLEHYYMMPLKQLCDKMNRSRWSLIGRVSVLKKAGKLAKVYPYKSSNSKLKKMKKQEIKRIDTVTTKFESEMNKLIADIISKRLSSNKRTPDRPNYDILLNELDSVSRFLITLRNLINDLKNSTLD